ncbi:MAG TPA: oligosaccharide flippase family protein, partial [Acidimicrobiales bacterium]|nr:oligosaccharide flippase family protein [Acidimicrobiales bacterium]
QTAVRVVALGSVVAVTRHLQPDQFGRYSTAAACVLFANFLADFGTSPAITRLSSRSPGEADRLLSGTLLSSLLLGLIVYAGVVAAAIALYPPLVTMDVALAALAVPAAAVVSSLLGALDGEGLIARRAVVTAVQGLIVAGGMVPVFLGAGVRAPIVAIAIAPWVGLVLAWRMARRAGFWKSPLRFDWTRTKALLRTAVPFGLSGGLTAITLRFDVILLSVLRPGGETASYDLAVRVIEAGTYLSSAICGPLLFILSGRIGREDREGASRAFSEAIRVMYLLGLPVSVTLAVLARPLVTLAFGPGFEDAATPLAVMGAAQWLAFVIMAQGALVMAGNAVGRGIVVGAMIALVTVVFDLLLVPPFGAVGAALATAVAWTFGAIALHHFHRRTHGIRTSLPRPAPLAAAAGMGLVMFLSRDAPLVVPVVLGLLTYVVCLRATGAVSGADVRRIRSVLARRAA